MFKNLGKHVNRSENFTTVIKLTCLEVNLDKVEPCYLRTEFKRGDKTAISTAKLHYVPLVETNLD